MKSGYHVLYFKTEEFKKESMRRTKDSRNADKTMIGKLGFILEAARKRIFRFFSILQDYTVIILTGSVLLQMDYVECRLRKGICRE